MEVGENTLRRPPIEQAAASSTAQAAPLKTGGVPIKLTRSNSIDKRVPG